MTERIALGVLVGAALGLLAWAAVGLFEGGDEPAGQSSHGQAGRRSVSSGPATTGSARTLPPGDSLVAQARTSRVPVYRSRAATIPAMELSNPNSDGALLVFLVAAGDQRRLRVRLPTRPNLSEGWIRRDDVRLALDPYRVEVHLARHVMSVWRADRLLERDPVGVGRRAVTPTPFGLYFITDLLKQPHPAGAYGPYAFGLSAHSDVLHTFAGGNGEIGIHGTNEPRSVGRDVSHGCIRVKNSVITRLARELPAGTPVRIEP